MSPAIADDFMPLAGDRAFADDPAIIGGLARIEGRRVMLIGHEKGDDTASRLKHNFGMAKPEGYRKAIRLMQLADRFGLPVVTLVDTSGAFPGVQAEERGQAEAIARSTEQCLAMGVPMIAAVVGEGGSGGAVAIAAANRVLMFEHAVYSVISPEGCASILWRTADKAADAAEAMRITAGDLQALGVVDRIVARAAWRSASGAGGSDRQPQGCDHRGAGRPGQARSQARSSSSGAPSSWPSARAAHGTIAADLPFIRREIRNWRWRVSMRTPFALLAATAAIGRASRCAGPAAALSEPAGCPGSGAAASPKSSRNLAAPRPGRAPPMSKAVGRRIAAYSGTANAGQVYHFTTLNSAVENAFAVPGGYVYITRQLMGIMNDESELAFVVGP